MVNRKNQQLSESSKNKTEGNAGWDRRQIQKVKLLNLNSRPFVKGQLKDLNRRIGKLSINPRRIFRLWFRSIPKHLWGSTKILRSAWEELAPLKSCLTADLTVLNVLLRTEESWWTSPRGRSFNEQFWFRILLPEINTSRRRLPCWGKNRPCVEIALIASW